MSVNQASSYLHLKMLRTEESIPDRFYKASNQLIDINYKHNKPSAVYGAFKFLLTAGCWTEHEQLRIMASERIPKYFEYFPTLQELAINSQLDLCEDDSLQVRKCAIQHLPLLCKSAPTFAIRIADVLCQLLQSDTEIELSVVRASLDSCFQMYFTQSLDAILNQINHGSGADRIACIAFFMQQKIVNHMDVNGALQIITKITESIKELALDVASFCEIIDFLKQLGRFSYHKNQGILVSLFENQCQSLPTDTPVAQIICLTNHLMPLLKAGYPGECILTAVSNKLKMFSTLDSKSRTHILKLASDLLYFGPYSLHTLSSLNQICFQVLMLLSTEWSFSNPMNLKMMEPLLNCMYKSHLLAPSISKSSSALNTRLSHVFATSQNVKDSCASDSKAYLCASNVHAFSRVSF